MVHRFVHLSDIHFGQEKNGKLIVHDDVRKALVADVEKMCATRGRATRVLITGDIAYSGKHTEYETATKWLEVLTKASQCDPTQVSTIPGNHDCDLALLTNQAKITYAQLRASPEQQAIANFYAILEDGETESPFLPKLKSYRAFANLFGCDFESAIRPCWARSFELPGGITLRVHGLTSVQVSNLEDAVGKMFLGNQQYIFDENSNVINIVLCHHPLDWFRDEKGAAQYLQNRAQVLMFGHEHEPNVQKSTDAFSQREWLVVSAGATSPPDADYGYSYNWLEFSCIEDSGKHYLVLEVFPRMWVKQRVQFEADRTLLGDNGNSVQVQIHCPQVQSQTSAEAAVAKTGPSTETTAHPQSSTSSDGKVLTENVGGLIMDARTADFDRLRYLFWRYLDWRERLKVLVEADALPHTVEEPLPQTMERKALDAAASTPGKLYELWEAVMPFVPREKQEKNPFKPQSKAGESC